MDAPNDDIKNIFGPRANSVKFRCFVGGVNIRSGHVRYVPVISADVPYTCYVH